MRLLFLFLLLIGSADVDAQTLQGKVVDEKTAEPIPFTSIGIVGTQISTVTNENGEFIIKAEKLPLTLRLGHVSYHRTEVLVSEASQSLTIKLSPASISLDAVEIRPDAGKNLLRSALLLALDHINDAFYSNAFYRQLTSNNDRPTEIHELFYDLNWNVKHVKGWAAKQSRFAELNDPSKFTLRNQSFLTFAIAGYIFPDKKGQYVSLKYLDDYEIEIDRIIEQNDQDIAVITCKLKKSKKRQFFVNSTYYVGFGDRKVYRVENKIYNLALDLSPNLKLRFPPIVETIATFNGSNQAIPTLESMSTKMHLALSTGGREFTSVISSLLTVFKIDDKLKNQQFRSVNSSVTDKAVIESIKYDPLFWKNNPIVKQTTLEDAFIKMMESKQAFGTMTNP
ncbi:MAG: carboxypeptidase-like regulatory domain-containing protein [Pedobacter sp.]|nr:MAG: carboxypeptidase-like regulatory domain-containing protein [Pedobacter sp.]